MEIYNFEQFKKLYESSELDWSMSGGSPAMPGGPYSGSNIDDYNLSTDGYSKFTISQKSWLNTLDFITKAVFSKDEVTPRVYKGYMPLQNITNVIIQRLENKIDSVDVYLSFVMDDIEYWSIFRNYGRMQPPKFVSELAFNKEHHSLSYDNYVRLQGILINMLDGFFSKIVGRYNCLKDGVLVYDKMGIDYMLNKKTYVIVEDMNNQSFDRYIKMKINMDKNNVKTVYMRGIDCLYFNYWFEPVDLKKQLI